MIVGFSGFGFPKAHGAAFGLLAYQSTWLRVHYGPEFLCSLLDEQPMGFYPPDALVHEAQRRGIEVLAPDVNASAVGARSTAASGARADRAGLRARRARATRSRRSWPRARRGGPFASLDDLASRAGAGRPALEPLAWSGACDALAAGARAGRGGALWQLGARRLGAPARRVGAAREGAQLALPLEPPARAGAAGRSSAWDGDDRRLRDHRPDDRPTHPLALLRDAPAGAGAVDERAT